MENTNTETEKPPIPRDFTKTHKYFDQLTIVCKSVCKDEKRYAMCHIEINENHIVSTNGYQFACLDNFGIVPGRYVAYKCNKQIIGLSPITVNGNFPKYMDILPDPIDTEDRCTIRPGSFCVKEGKLSLLMFDIVTEGAAVSIPMLKDFMSAASFFVSSKDKPIHFYAENFIGVIMPFDTSAK